MFSPPCFSHSRSHKLSPLSSCPGYSFDSVERGLPRTSAGRAIRDAVAELWDGNVRRIFRAAEYGRPSGDEGLRWPKPDPIYGEGSRVQEKEEGEGRRHGVHRVLAGIGEGTDAVSSLERIVGSAGHQGGLSPEGSDFFAYTLRRPRGLACAATTSARWGRLLIQVQDPRNLGGRLPLRHHIWSRGAGGEKQGLWCPGAALRRPSPPVKLAAQRTEGRPKIFHFPCLPLLSRTPPSSSPPHPFILLPPVEHLQVSPTFAQITRPTAGGKGKGKGGRVFWIWGHPRADRTPRGPRSSAWDVDLKKAPEP